MLGGHNTGAALRDHPIGKVILGHSPCSEPRTEVKQPESRAWLRMLDTLPQDSRCPRFSHL